MRFSKFNHFEQLTLASCCTHDRYKRCCCNAGNHRFGWLQQQRRVLLFFDNIGRLTRAVRLLYDSLRSTAAHTAVAAAHSGNVVRNYVDWLDMAEAITAI